MHWNVRCWVIRSRRWKATAQQPIKPALSPIKALRGQAMGMQLCEAEQWICLQLPKVRMALRSQESFGRLQESFHTFAVAFPIHNLLSPIHEVNCLRGPIPESVRASIKYLAA